jgi:hypothetical protein
LLQPGGLQADLLFTTTNGTLTLVKYLGAGGDVIVPAVTNGMPVVEIDDGAFTTYTNITSVVLGQNITNIGGAAFYYCTGLLRVSLPARLAVIGDYAFSFCTNLAQITIPRSVGRIASSAFDTCLNLEGVFFQGNPPALGTSVFAAASKSTVYYLPGTSGWAATFGGRPAVLWNPLIQTGPPDFGVRSNRFGFRVTGTANIPVVIEAAANPATGAWTALQNGTLTNGSLNFSDAAWTNHSSRVYRVRSP